MHRSAFSGRIANRPISFCWFFTPATSRTSKAPKRVDVAFSQDGSRIVSAGLDYPGVGPEHAYLKDIGRAEYVAITDKEALEAFHLLTEVEGIITALEPSHAIAYAVKLAKEWSSDKTIIINLSGRGYKDMQTIAEVEGIEF